MNIKKLITEAEKLIDDEQVDVCPMISRLVEELNINGVECELRVSLEWKPVEHDNHPSLN